MSKKIDLTGKVFGRWVAIEHCMKGHSSMWLCRCVCGTERLVLGDSLRTGKSQSCGCLKKEQMSERFKTHGMSGTPEYNSYNMMIDRCTNPNNQDYEHYTSRGISVCSEFLESFENFYKEIGPRPQGKWSVGRIDNTQGYIIGNIRWENDNQQARNHSLQKNNTSGHAGICVREDSGNNRVIARVGIGEKKRISKTFNINKLGLEEALAQAIAWRKLKLKELENQGILYGEHHGKPDKEIYDTKG